MVAFADVFTPWKALQIVAVALIGVYAYRKDSLNAAGALTAFAMGALIVLFTNLSWLLLLVSLLLLGSAATRFRFDEKRKAKLEEKGGGPGGRRRSRNVVANGLAPTAIAVLTPVIVDTWGSFPATIAFASAIAAAASDTLASEFGSLADRVRLITTLKPVPPGTDGGVSLVGQVAAAGGALVIALLGLLFLGVLTPEPLRMAAAPAAIWLPAVAGFMGCQVDSVLGATLEGDGLLTKEEVNLIAASTAGVGGLLGAIAFA